LGKNEPNLAALDKIGQKQIKSLKLFSKSSLDATKNVPPAQKGETFKDVFCRQKKDSFLFQFPLFAPLSADFAVFF